MLWPNCPNRASACRALIPASKRRLVPPLLTKMQLPELPDCKEITSMVPSVTLPDAELKPTSPPHDPSQVLRKSSSGRYGFLTIDADRNVSDTACTPWQKRKPNDHFIWDAFGSSSIALQSLHVSQGTDRSVSRHRRENSVLDDLAMIFEAKSLWNSPQI
jgi:hypothetical protein